MNATRDNTFTALGLAMCLFIFSDTASADMHADELTAARQESQISTT